MLALLPNTAFAEVCDKERPGWDGTPVTMFEEPLGQLSNPFKATFVGGSIFLILRGRRIPILLGILVISVYSLVFLDPLYLDDVKWAAKREGCLGNEELWWATLAMIFVLGWFKFARSFRRVVA